MENTEIITPKKRDMYLNIIIVQSLCVVVILASVLTVKYFFVGTYNKVKEWYSSNICIDTDINQVLETDKGEGEISEV